MILIIDATCICHIAKHSIKKLTWQELQTGVVFGFMQHVIRLARKFGTNKFVFAWDSRKSVRKVQYPSYKQVRQTRDKSSEELFLDDIAYSQFNLIRSWVLKRCGFRNSFIQTGLEADDIIARIALDYRDENMIIVTTDTDLYQVLNGNCAMYSPRSKKLYTAEDFKKEWGLPPYQWATILSIAGCDTDEVKGVDRVGKITAAKFLKGELKGSTKACQAIMSEEGKMIVSRNKDLVKLPHANTNYVSLKRFDTLRTDGFLDVFNKFGFLSFLKHEEFQRWRKAMKM